MKHLFANHDLATTRCGEFIDVTDDVVRAVEDSGVMHGVALVYTPHTTCAVLINEQERGFIEDFGEILEAVAPKDRAYHHDDLETRTEGIERGRQEVANGHAHCRASLIGAASQAVPVYEGRAMLGRYQRIFFCELDRPKDRKLFIQILGQ